MLAHTQNETYFNRMKSSMSDKFRMTERIKGVNILDVGCGDGSFPLMLKNSEQYRLVAALDGSESATIRAKEQGLDNIANCYAHQAAQFSHRTVSIQSHVPAFFTKFTLTGMTLTGLLLTRSLFTEYLPYLNNF